MINDDQVCQQYARPGLVAAIEEALAAAGKPPPGVTVEDLAPVDEFHAGGRAATKELMAQLQLRPGASVLDVGCGLGGAARYCAAELGVRVTGVDITPDYIEAAKALTSWVDLGDGSVAFRRASAVELPFKKRSFDAAYLMHVGMNVADKTGLFSSVARVLRPGGRIGVYDLMRAGDGELAFPLPWATTPALSFLTTAASYEASLTAAGFEVVSRQDHAALARQGVGELRASLDRGDEPALGLHLLMGDSTAAKLANLAGGLDSGKIVPYGIIARRG